MYYLCALLYNDLLIFKLDSYFTYILYVAFNQVSGTYPVLVYWLLLCFKKICSFAMYKS